MSKGSGESKDSNQTGQIAKQVVIKLDAAWNDARKIVKTDGQLIYVGDVFERLADFGNRSETADLCIVKVNGKIWKLEVKGFVLGSIAMGVCFAHVTETSQIVVLGVVDSDVGTTLKPHLVIKMERRLAYYLDELAQ